MWWFGGHLGSAVSALVDGQLDEESAERAWAHVVGCSACRRLVEREGWVKRQLAEMAGTAPSTPPTDLLGSLYELEPATHPASRHPHARDAWAVVQQLEHRARPRRRAGLAAVGVGSVSAAVIGLSTLGAAPLDIGNAPAVPPTSSLSRATNPSNGPATSTPTPSTGPFSWRLGSSTDTTRTLPVRLPR